MGGRWLFVTLPLAALSVMLSGHLWAGLVLVILAWGRIFTLRSARIVVITGLIFVVIGGVWWGRQRQLAGRRLSAFTESPASLTVRFQPDALSIRGTTYSFVGQNVTTGERLIFHGRIGSAAELHHLQTVDRAQSWRIQGTQSGILPATNFNQFDGAAYWSRRGIVKQVRIAQVTPLVTTTGPLTWWSDWWHGLRAHLIQACQRLPGALKVYALGLFPGYRALEATQELEGMQRLGLLHLFSISGLHVSLVLLVVEWLCVHCRLPRDLWERGMIVGLPGYFILAGGGSSILRASLMRGLQLSGRQLGLRVSGLDAWSLTLIVALMGNTGLLFELGSQLSFGLSLVLILLEQESFAWRQIGLALVSLPSLLNGLFQWHLLTLLANWLVVPLFPVLLLPLTVIGTLIFPWAPEVSRGCATLLGWFDQAMTWLGTLPGNLVFGKPWWWVCWLWIWLALGIFSRPVGQRRKFLRLLAMSYVLMYGAIHFPWHGEVAYFDVGQGDSILIRERFNRHVSLIDTGGHLGFQQPRWVPKIPVTYAADRTSVTYLRSRGVTTIDDLYLTHHDADHIGDLPAVLKAFRVKRLLVPAGMEQEPAWQHLLANRQATTALVSIKTTSDLPLTVRHPFEAAPAENANSLALQGQYGGLNFLFMGDLDQAGEQKMLEVDPHLRTDVLKLGHHGSKTASGVAFLNQVRPRWGIISAGRHNRYGHPNPETLARLRADQIPAVSTQTSGMIRYVFTGQHGEWQTKLKGD